MRTRSALFLPLFVLLWLAWPGVSRAQINATLRFPHETYLASEQVVVTLTVNSGSTVDGKMNSGPKFTSI